LSTRNEPALPDARSRVWLGLGGNIGEVKSNMASALLRMEQECGIHIVAVSRLYSTPPWGEPDQPDFLNACAGIKTSLSPEDLIVFVKSIEKAMKRNKTSRWGPRNIDIDLLIYEGETRDQDKLELPHPRMRERAFVMIPLAEIAADLSFGGKTIAGWASMTDATGLKTVSDDGDWWRQEKEEHV